MVTVPRLPRYYQGATAPRPRMSFGSLVSPAGSAGACPVPVRSGALPLLYRPGDEPEVWILVLAVPVPVSLPAGQEQNLRGFLATHPVTLRRSATPDAPRCASPFAPLTVLPPHD